MSAEFLIAAPADRTSRADFLREFRGDPNNISGLPQAGGYYLLDGAWMIIRPHHYWEQLTETVGDPLLNRGVA